MNPPTLDSLWTSWHTDPSVLLGLIALQAAYLLGIGPLRRRYGWADGVSRRQVVCFQLALLTIYIATQSPLHDLADTYLFSAHMVQHMLLAQVMPPLLLLGLPAWLLRPLLRLPGVRPLAAVLTTGVVAFFLFDAVFAIWHFPVYYDAASENHNLHIFQHLMFMVTAVILWWPIFSPLPELPPLSQPLQMLYLFLQSIPTSIIGALVTLVDEPSYKWYVQAPRIVNLSALDDQKLGGLIMWVPGSMLFWVFLTVVFFQWWERNGEQQDEIEQAAIAG